MGESRAIVHTIVKRKNNWVGYVMRGNGLLREVMTVMEERVLGKKGLERPGIEMLDELLEKETFVCFLFK